MNWKKFALAALAALLLVPAQSGGTQAEELTGTLKKIKDTGIITVGHRESSVPFSYYDLQQNVVGYAQDYSDKIVAAVKKKLSMPNLKVRYVPITSQNRIPLLQNGTFDFECGSTTNNLERQQQVAFSNTFFIVGTRLLVDKNSGIKDFADLKGKNVAVTAGTTSEKLLNKMNDEKKMGIHIISVKDHGDAFRTVESGRAVAFFIDDALLAGERAKAKNPAQWAIVGTPQSYEAYGCMVRKGDAPFKKLVDDVIAEMQLSGVAEKSYQRWFMQPIPPKGMNMNFEMSKEMKALFKTPNDKALD
ncbi:glutamate/aspartate ABC transporter substrate-binding protein [Desulfovibrio legallii]|uniref:L-glutamate-binding protein /L-aspartate-binding protein n=1 Tax=Desulfovibrio legallii TaxID=571438 RepID=A0A1G7JJA6_9BACT|nr:glutamate/aspartate ABC transporter substrate-binding protein [Desulfovibrio legallii]SDF24998.1 L-glutamate-binding protein /L-aspartate-binding protein [Desulfovibrio legallii]